MATIVGELSDRFASVSNEVRGVVAHDGTLIAASPSWTRVLGWPLGHLVNHPLTAVVHPKDFTRLETLIAHTVGVGSVDGVDLRVRHAAGGHRWLRCAAVAAPEQAVVYLTAIDVTRHHQDRAVRELIEQQAEIGTWELDLGTGRMVWSATTYRLHGTDPAHTSASVAEGLVRYPPTARAVIESAFERLVEHAEPYDVELPFHPDGGGEITVRTCGRAVVRSGVVVRVFGTIQNVSALVDRERYERQLEQATARLEQSQRLAQLGNWEFDLATEALNCSRVVFEIFGVDPDRFVPTRDAFMAAVRAEDREMLKSAGVDSLRTGEHTVDYRIVRPDGQERNLRQVGRTVCDAQGQPVQLVGTVQDVTELSRAEQALIDTQELLQRVLAATRDGWWDLDLVTGSAYYSDRWYELCGYTRDQLPDEVDLWRRLTHPDDLPRFETDLEEVFTRRERTFALPSAGLHRAGHRVPMVVRGLVDYDDDGQPARISGATEDVSEARQAEIAKHDFISTVSHELRTPLTSVGGALELLAGGRVGTLSTQATQLVEIARRNACRMRLLIDDLLDIERLMSDRQPLALAQQPLHPLLERAVQDNAPFATQYDVRFVHQHSGPEVIVEADAQRLQQVLVNYLANAATFAPAGSNVIVGARRSPDRDGQVRVEVVDSGPGLPADLANSVFDRFVWADSEDRRIRGGTGLGLAIAREIIERHGGRVGVVSRPGRTCFWFDLPIVARAAASAGADPGVDPATDPGADPATDPGADPGADPATDHETDPVAHPEADPGTDPGD